MQRCACVRFEQSCDCEHDASEFTLRISECPRGSGDVPPLSLDGSFHPQKCARSSPRSTRDRRRAGEGWRKSPIECFLFCLPNNGTYLRMISIAPGTIFTPSAESTMNFRMLRRARLTPFPVLYLGNKRGDLSHRRYDRLAVILRIFAIFS